MVGVGKAKMKMVKRAGSDLAEELFRRQKGRDARQMGIGIWNPTIRTAQEDFHLIDYGCELFRSTNSQKNVDNLRAAIIKLDSKEDRKLGLSGWLYYFTFQSIRFFNCVQCYFQFHQQQSDINPEFPDFARLSYYKWRFRICKIEGNLNSFINSIYRPSEYVIFRLALAMLIIRHLLSSNLLYSNPPYSQVQFCY